MSLYITSLNSGSNGNCYYIGNDQEAILIDAGISCREIEKRMKRSGLSMDKVKAIFVSHEHTDHISGIPVLSKKYQLPVYTTEATRRHCGLLLKEHLIIRFFSNEPVRIGDLSISAFPKFHDACDPHSFIVTSNSVKVGIFTDIGFACEQVMLHFKQCHAAFLEANYDRNMLIQGTYPYHLKRRIMSGRGHLSNTQALQLVVSHKPAFMSHLLLSHLSANNNCPTLVYNMFSQYAGRTTICVASRFEETPVYTISGQDLPRARVKIRHTTPRHIQLSLF